MKMVDYKKLQAFVHSDKEDGREFIHALYEFGENMSPVKARQLLNLLDDECDCHDAMVSIIRILENLSSDEHVKAILKWIISDSYKHSNYLESVFYRILNHRESYYQLKKYTELLPSENLRTIFVNIKAYAESTEMKKKIDFEHIKKCSVLLKILDKNLRNQISEIVK